MTQEAGALLNSILRCPQRNKPTDINLLIFRLFWASMPRTMFLVMNSFLYLVLWQRDFFFNNCLPKCCCFFLAIIVLLMHKKVKILLFSSLSNQFYHEPACLQQPRTRPTAARPSIQPLFKSFSKTCSCSIQSISDWLKKTYWWSLRTVGTPFY